MEYNSNVDFVCNIKQNKALESSLGSIVEGQES